MKNPNFLNSVFKVKKKFIRSNVDITYMASRLRKLVNSMGNHFILLKKPVPWVNQRVNLSGTEIHGLMSHFFGLSYFTAIAISKY